MTRHVVVLGLSLSSSWGNGHATTYRALLRSLAARGHRITFLERDVPWYASNRDMPEPTFAQLRLYSSLEELKAHGPEVSAADYVLVGSFVPDGPEVIDWVLATARGPVGFYDIDTPITVARLSRDDCAYLRRDQVPKFAHYLSFSGGPILQRIEREFGARHALPLYCAVDPTQYFHEGLKPTIDLGYMGTYSDDRQPTVDRLLIETARRWPTGRFVVAGPQYPESIAWPDNVARIEHLTPCRHRDFYNRQRFTLNVTRGDMIAAGWSPSVRLFEAAACGTACISDQWPGLDDFFKLESEIIVASTTDDALQAVREMSDDQRAAVGDAARARILGSHTSDHRAEELDRIIEQSLAMATP